MVVSPKTILRFSWNFKLFQMRMVVSPNTVPVAVDQGLNTGKSNNGLRKMKYYLKCDKIGLTSCCTCGPDKRNRKNVDFLTH